MKSKKVVLGCLFGFIGFLVLIVVIGVVIALTSGTGGKTKEIREIMNIVSVEKEQAEDINKILNDIGIETFESISVDESLNGFEGENSKGYRIKTSFAENIIMYVLNDSLFSIRLADKDFYKNEQVLLNFKDFTMTAKEQADYQTRTEKGVKELLKSPSTAKFAGVSNWSISKDNGIITIQSYVDSQNSFGAIVRSNFQVVYDKEDKVSSLIIDGVEYIK